MTWADDIRSGPQPEKVSKGAEIALTGRRDMFFKGHDMIKCIKGNSNFSLKNFRGQNFSRRAPCPSSHHYRLAQCLGILPPRVEIATHFMHSISTAFTSYIHCYVCVNTDHLKLQVVPFCAYATAIMGTLSKRLCNKTYNVTVHP